MTVELAIALIGDLGAMGFILYLTHRLTTHTIPRLAAEFEKAQEKQRQDFRESLQDQRQDFQLWQEREIKSHEAQAGQVVETLKDLTREVRGGTGK